MGKRRRNKFEKAATLSNETEAIVSAEQESEGEIQATVDDSHSLKEREKCDIKENEDGTIEATPTKESEKKNKVVYIRHNWLDSFDFNKYYLFQRQKLESGQYSKNLILLSFSNYHTAKAYFDEKKLAIPEWFIMKGIDFVNQFSFHVMNLRKYIKKQK